METIELRAVPIPRAEILADTLEQVASLPESEAISVNEISIKVLIKKN